MSGVSNHLSKKIKNIALKLFIFLIFVSVIFKSNHFHL